MLTQPNLIPMPFANSGDANTIPETNPSPSTTSAASWTSGFPVINSTPLAAGGIPPAREDFNGAFKALSEHTMWEQSGNPYTWSEDLDYVANARTQGSDGKMYVAKQNSGPNTDAGAQDPTTDDTDDYWILEEDLYGAKRNPGELVYSMLPIEDASLHLVDGTVLSGSGMYADFVSYVAGLIENQPNSSNVYKVGNIADVDNVLSGFTTSSYAKLPFAFSPGSSPWEMVFKVTTGGNVTTEQHIQNCYNPNNLALLIIGSHFRIAVGNGTSWNIVDKTGAYTVLQNTTYYVRTRFTGSAYTLEYSLDGSSYTTDISESSSVSVPNSIEIRIGLSSNVQSPFLGSIDLSASYININNSRWWSGTHKAGFMDEAEWQATVSKYKACGCFVYDEVANTLRLPKVTGFLEGTVDPSALGTLVEAGLPNITATSNYGITGYITSATGAFYKIDASAQTAGSAGANTGCIGLDASRSSPIYGNSTTVQPQAIKGFVYMVVANRTKTQIVADIDEIAADLQLKADVDLGNVTSAGQVRMAHAAMAGRQFEELSVPASNDYVTAPADGYLFFEGEGNGGMGALSLDWLNSQGTTVGICGGYILSQANELSGAFLPVSSGDRIRVYYRNARNLRLFFVYANGSAS